MLITLLLCTVTLGGIGLLVGTILAQAERRFKPNQNSLVEQINRLLPQTQCAQCGYPGCRPYAEALSQGEAINKCPPGGTRTLQALADLLNVAPLPLATAAPPEGVKTRVVIREEQCIGCTQCIQACPVDAIIGAAKLMHTVIADQCTGCDLCIDPCPVDCIDRIVLPPASAPFPLELIASDQRPRTA